MSQDNYGNEIPAAVQHTDEEYAYPPVGWKAVATERKICAQDERFASVNEAIGLLQYNAEQDSERISDLLVRVEKLEAAQPIPQISRWPAEATPPYFGYAHIPAAEWEDIKAELEALRAFKAGVPWGAIRRAQMSRYIRYDDAEDKDACRIVDAWHAANAPKGAAE